MNLAQQLGAADAFSTQRLCLYFPDKDRVGNEVHNYENWVKETREILSRIGGGATALPSADGTWEMQDGQVLWERTRLIYCFIDPNRFEANVSTLRTFLHRFGRETNQGEVVVEFDDQFFRIKAYDEPRE